MLNDQRVSATETTHHQWPSASASAALLDLLMGGNHPIVSGRTWILKEQKRQD
jgi:hypothetical protein